jgi:hypothetical protein
MPGIILTTATCDSDNCTFLGHLGLHDLNIMDHLHWHCLLAKLSATATLDCTCLGHLGRCDTDRIVYIYIMPPKVAKASTTVIVECCCCLHYHRCYRSKLRECKHGFNNHICVALPKVAKASTVKCRCCLQFC